jgi:hypothetical protein
MSSKLRLGPLPKTETIKLTITLSGTLKADLERYAELHAQTWGSKVDAMTLIPHILEAFLARDRAFRTSKSSARPGGSPRAQ